MTQLLPLALLALIATACGGPAAPRTPTDGAKDDRADIVALLVEALSRSFVEEGLDSLRAAGALGFYGEDPRAVAALADCAQRKGDMSELGAQCGDSLIVIGMPAAEHLQPLVQGADSKSFLFTIYAGALDDSSIERLVPLYAAACARNKTAPNHRDDHKIHAGREALGRAPLHSTPALEAFRTNDPAQRACIDETLTALRNGDLAPDSP